MAAIPIAIGTKKNSFRAVKNQKIACDFLIFYRSLKFYLPPQAAICLMRQPQKNKNLAPKKSFAAKGGMKKLHEPLRMNSIEK
jgi:hypothetical protein